MSEFLRALQSDHAKMAHLLELLERQLDIFDQGKTPDYELVGGILDYCIGYPDRFHHPKEDAILDQMARSQPENLQVQQELKEDHEKLAILTKRFADAMEQVLQDQEVPRDWFGQTGRQFIRHYRRHLNWEEEEVFPRAAESLSTDEWADIEALFSGDNDPLFGAGDEARFKALREELLAFDGASDSHTRSRIV